MLFWTVVSADQSVSQTLRGGGRRRPSCCPGVSLEGLRNTAAASQGSSPVACPSDAQCWTAETRRPALRGDGQQDIRKQEQHSFDDISDAEDTDVAYAEIETGRWSWSISRCCGIRLGGQRKIKKYSGRVACAMAKIRTRHFWSAYRWTNLRGSWTDGDRW